MKKILVIAVLATLPKFVQAQDLSELDRRNGFKTIILGSSIDSVKGIEFKKDIIERKEFPAKIYETSYKEYMSIGEVAVKKLQINTYSGLIYEIHVLLNKDPRVMQGLERAFGPAAHSMRLDAYYWKSEKLSLIFKGEGKKIHLTYRSAPMFRMMQADKSKKANEVAEDF